MAVSILKCPYCSDSIRKSGAYIVGIAAPFFMAPAPAPSKPFRRLRLRPKCVGSGFGSASLASTNSHGSCEWFEHECEILCVMLEQILQLKVACLNFGPVRGLAICPTIQYSWQMAGNWHLQNSDNLYNSCCLRASIVSLTAVFYNSC